MHWVRRKLNTMVAVQHPTWVSILILAKKLAITAYCCSVLLQSVSWFSHCISVWNVTLNLRPAVALALFIQLRGVATSAYTNQFGHFPDELLASVFTAAHTPVHMEISTACSCAGTYSHKHPTHKHINTQINHQYYHTNTLTHLK